MDAGEMTNLGDTLQAVVSGLQMLRPLIGGGGQQESGSESNQDLKNVFIDLQDAVLSVQSIALESQNERSRLLSRIADLEKQIKSDNDWAKDKDRYKLVSWGSAHVYALRKEVQQEGEPIHRVCPYCYEEQSKAILQKLDFKLRCGRCDAEFYQ